jgi:hypothetical protein
MCKLALAFVAVSIIAGCAMMKPALHVTAAPSKPLATGWSQAESKDGEVSVGVPNGWRFGADRTLQSLGGLQNMGLSDGDMNNPQVQQLAQELQKNGDEEEKQELERLYQKGIVIHVINGSRPIADEMRTKYVVHRYDLNGNWDWDSAADFERKQYAFKPDRKEVKLPIGKALRLEKSEELRNGSMRHRISFLAIEGSRLYVLRFVTQESRETIATIADEVAKTLRVQPANIKKG